MEVIEPSEAFQEKSGDLEFSHTKVIPRKNNDYFYAINTLLWRYNGQGGVCRRKSLRAHNYRTLVCVRNRLFITWVSEYLQLSRQNSCELK